MSLEPRLVIRKTLDELSPDWDSLVEKAPVISPFLRSWWLSGVGAEESFFVLVIDEDVLIGGIPLELQATWGGQFIQFMGGSMSPDNLDVLCEPGREREVVNALRAWFTSQRIGRFDFRGVVESSLLVRCLPSGCRVELDTEVPIAKVEGTFDEFVASRSYQNRKRINKPRNALQRLDVVCEEVSSDEALSALLDLHQKQFPNSGFVPVMDAFANTAGDGARRNELRFFAAKAPSGEIIAVETFFSVAGRFTSYQVGRNTDPKWNHVGNALSGKIVELAFDEGCGEIDFGRGVTRSKTTFATGSRSLYRVRITRGAKGYLAIWMDRFDRRILRKVFR